MHVCVAAGAPVRVREDKREKTKRPSLDPRERKAEDDEAVRAACMAHRSHAHPPTAQASELSRCVRAKQGRMYVRSSGSDDPDDFAAAACVQRFFTSQDTGKI
jgi:phage tail tape-measure protein